MLNVIGEPCNTSKIAFVHSTNYFKRKFIMAQNEMVLLNANCYVYR